MCTGYQTKLDLKRVLWFGDDLFVALLFMKFELTVEE